MKYRNAEERRLGHLERCKQYRLRHPERIIASKEAWRKKNMQKYRDYSEEWRLKNPKKRASIIREWAQKNKARLNAVKAKRMADKKKATPSWANQFFIEEIYDLARRRTEVTGFKWSVDHIVPMKSDLVCGLHVEHNLRVIPHVENISKKNRHWPHGIGFDKHLNI